MRAFAIAVLMGTVASCGSGSGGRCTAATDCQSGLVCITGAPSGSDAGAMAPRACMRLCDHDAGDGVDQRLCSDGTVCTPLDGARVCYVGGSHRIGSACTSDLDCEAGTICAPDTMLCTQACTVGTNAPCAMNEACMAIGGGLCRPISVVVDGGH